MYKFNFTGYLRSLNVSKLPLESLEGLKWWRLASLVLDRQFSRPPLSPLEVPPSIFSSRLRSLYFENGADSLKTLIGILKTFYYTLGRGPFWCGFCILRPNQMTFCILRPNQFHSWKIVSTQANIRNEIVSKNT